MGASSERDYLDDQPRMCGLGVEQMDKLVVQDGRAAHRVAQGRLADDGPDQWGIVAVKQVLAFHPGGYLLLYGLIRVPRLPGSDEGASVSLGLKKARYVQGLPRSDAGGFALDFRERAEPAGQGLLAHERPQPGQRPSGIECQVAAFCKISCWRAAGRLNHADE